VRPWRGGDGCFSPGKTSLAIKRPVVNYPSLPPPLETYPQSVSVVPVPVTSYFYLFFLFLRRRRSLRFIAHIPFAAELHIIGRKARNIARTFAAP
jgi:hypothetical protein